MTLPCTVPTGLDLDQWLDAAWAQPPAITTIPVAGGTLSLRQWGKEQGDLPAIVFVHGFMASGNWWDHVAPHFLPYGRAIAIDLSGMGNSDRRSAYSIESRANDLVAVVRQLRLRRPIFVAHSYGVQVAYRACAIEPAAAAALIMIDGVPAKLLASRQQIGESPQRFFPSREAALGRFRLMPPGAWPNARILQYIAEGSIRETARGWTSKVDPRCSYWFNQDQHVPHEIDPDLPKILILGDRSEVISAAQVWACEQLSHSHKSLVIANCHHHVMIEQPMSLVSALHKAIEVVDPEAARSSRKA